MAVLLRNRGWSRLPAIDEEADVLGDLVSNQTVEATTDNTGITG